MDKLLQQIWEEIHQKSSVPQPAGLVAAAFYEKYHPSQTELLYMLAHLLDKTSKE